MEKISREFVLPSGAFTLKRSQIKYYIHTERKPQVGDLVYGEVLRLGQHSSLENISGRIHAIHDGKRAIFVFGNRYAPDYYEGFVPESSASQKQKILPSKIRHA